MNTVDHLSGIIKGGRIIRYNCWMDRNNGRQQYSRFIFNSYNDLIWIG